MTDGLRQFALDLRHRAAMGREDFLVSASNAEAAAWIDRWPDWPGPALVLVGPPGSGKSHLGQVWRTRSRARVFGAGAAPGFGDGDAGASAIIEDADRQAGDAEVLHLYNAVVENGGHVLVTARQPPARWAGRLPDLVSRLAAAPTARIGSPDEALISAVIVKMLADHRLDIAENVLTYLVTRMELSFAAAEGLVADINRVSLSARRGVTLSVVREALRRRAPEPD